MEELSRAEVETEVGGRSFDEWEMFSAEVKGGVVAKVTAPPT